MMRQFQLVERVKRYNPAADEALLNRAYIYAMRAHGSQKRASGDLYFGHPLEVAAILTDLKLDDATIVAAVLHDTIEDTEATRDEINRVSISETLEKYIIELVFATRRPLDYGLKEEAAYIQFGVSPRASINLNRAAKAMAFLNGRDYVLPEDIKEVAHDVMNHRLLLNYEAEADGITPSQIVEMILKKVAIGR